MEGGDERLRVAQGHGRACQELPGLGSGVKGALVFAHGQLIPTGSDSFPW